MHKLDRASVPAPMCLSSYSHGMHNWDSVTAEHKEQIRSRLEALQGRRCAYCEGPLDALGQHIEHFRRKSQFPTLTFAWDNLFWSCDCTDRCGHFKDHGAGQYNPDDLIDPARLDPEHFLRFFSDGSIRLRQGLGVNEQFRATETLRVFNLDHQYGPLRQIRMTHCLGYVRMAQDIAELAEQSTVDEWLPFLEAEVASTLHLPYATAIKHTLSPA